MISVSQLAHIMMQRERTYTEHYSGTFCDTVIGVMSFVQDLISDTYKIFVRGKHVQI